MESQCLRQQQVHLGLTSIRLKYTFDNSKSVLTLVKLRMIYLLLTLLLILMLWIVMSGKPKDESESSEGYRWWGGRRMCPCGRWGMRGWCPCGRRRSWY